MKKLTYTVFTFCLLLTAQFAGLLAQPICNPDTQAPVVACDADITRTLDEETMSLEMTAADFVAQTFDNCSEQVLIRLEIGTGGTEPPLDSTLTFTEPGLYIVVVWAGDESGNWNQCFTTVLVLDANSQSKSFEGLLFADTNGNCVQDVGESGLAGLPVEAVATTTFGIWKVTGLTDANGNYALEMNEVLVSEATSLEVRAGNVANTGIGCPPSTMVPDGYFDAQNTFIHDLGIGLEAGCHQLQVDISALALRRCFVNTYYVNYCNYGAAMAPNASIEIEFDDYLTVNSSTVPWSSVSGNTYTFELGDVAPGACNDFSISVNVNCEATLGQSHCTTAEIFPRSNCQASFSGAELSVTGDCVDGEVVFTITNIGESDMDSPIEYYVVEDVIMFMSAPVQLASGQSTQVVTPANGATYRLELPQVPGHPYSVNPSATVEGCGTNSEGTVSLGFVTQFSQGDDAPQIDIDCQENIGSYDPNDKQVFPRGTTDERLIVNNIELEYLIRFQNTGTDTAFTVVVLDRLSDELDLATVRPGASTHPYTFTLLEDRVLRFSFNNIMLPDSNVNQAASQGFVKFSVKQLPDLSDGTIIENQAAIYFDFNEPVLTNTVRQVIGSPFVTVSSTEPGLGSKCKTQILPNPLNMSALIQVKGLETEVAQFNLYHTTGALLQQIELRNGEARINAGTAPAGLYYFTVTANGRQVDSGKIIFSGK